MQNVTRKGYIEMNFAELERYFDVFNKLKDDEKEFPNKKVALTILHYHVAKEHTNDDGIAFLIANAIRKHRGLAYPIYHLT